MILESERIRLRPFKMEDLGKLHSWHNNPDLRCMAMMHPYPITLENDKQWLSNLMIEKSSRNIFFAAEMVENNELIGYFKLIDINLINRHSFLGIIIGDPHERGKGLGKEIIEIGLGYAFNILGLHKISLEVVEVNELAINFYKRLGFIQEGFFKNHFFFNGKWYGVIRMAKGAS